MLAAIKCRTVMVTKMPKVNLTCLGVVAFRPSQSNRSRVFVWPIPTRGHNQLTHTVGWQHPSERQSHNPSFQYPLGGTTVVARKEDGKGTSRIWPLCTPPPSGSVVTVKARPSGRVATKVKFGGSVAGASIWTMPDAMLLMSDGASKDTLNSSASAINVASSGSATAVVALASGMSSSSMASDNALRWRGNEVYLGLGLRRPNSASAEEAVPSAAAPEDDDAGKSGSSS
mmetsp:Transcript_14168/g.33860  ORF Transcript_14168/g.33860 Transcript_14168/m.33860 type:complete len:229 (-) Transcript_14168:191-877(-)